MRSTVYKAPRWKVKPLLISLGPYSALADTLVERGYPRLPVGTISAWASRGLIPAPWMPAILDLALDARLIGSIKDFREPHVVKRRHRRTKPLQDAA